MTKNGLPQSHSGDFTAWKNWSAEGAGSSYDNEFIGPVGHYINESEIQAVMRLIDTRQAKRILDAGCGTGRHLLEFDAHNVRVGMDYSLDMAKTAKAKIKGSCFVVGDVTAMPFKEEAFDHVICVRVLQHVYDQQTAIKECARVCKTNGAVVTLCLNAWTLHCLYKTFRMNRWLRPIVNIPFYLIFWRRSPFNKWGFSYDNYCSAPELKRMYRAVELEPEAARGDTFGAPWFFNYFFLRKLLLWIFPWGLEKYFVACRFLDRCLGARFPFTHILVDKITLKGKKLPSRAT